MGLANSLLVEATKIVWAAAPKDITGAGLTGDLVCLKYHRKMAIVLLTGAWAGGTAAVTLTQATDAAGGTTASFAFDYQYVGTGLTSDTLVKTAVSSNTFNLSAANKIHVIEVLASDLTAGYTHVRCEVATPGSNADLLAMAYVLYGSSYTEGVASQPSVIA
jgi:hypothetical protein